MSGSSPTEIKVEKIIIRRPQQTVLDTLEKNTNDLSAYFKNNTNELGDILPYFMHRAHYSKRDKQNAITILTVLKSISNNLLNNITLDGYIRKIKSNEPIDAGNIPTILSGITSIWSGINNLFSNWL